MNATARTLIQTSRPPFLLLAVVCVLLGSSIAYQHSTDISLTDFTLVLLGGLMAHMSVNMLNEYLDFKSGLDLQTTRTPFSGGSGALPDNPTAAYAVRTTASLFLALTMMIGTYFLYRQGLGLFLPGLIGIVLILAYTGWANRHPFFCLIFPGLGFGMIMIPATQYALLGMYLTEAWLIAIVPFFLTNNLLLLNQYPDIEADRAAGRNHIVIRYGTSFGNFIYAIFLLLTQIVILTLYLYDIIPAVSLLALLPTLPGFYALCGAIKFNKTIGQHPGYLAANVTTVLLTPLVLALTIVFN